MHPYKSHSKTGRELAKKRYADGGDVEGEVNETPVPPSPFMDVKPSRAPRVPKKPSPDLLPPNKI